MTRQSRPRTRALLAASMLLPLGACLYGEANTVTRLQGWTAEERGAWYWATQGSRLMPKAWFAALEQAGGSAPFAAMDHLSGYGFLPPPDGSESTMPIGFATDRQADGDFKVTGLRWYEGQAAGEATAEPWVGLNCAACHTARMEYNGVVSTVDGGPNLLDFQSFIEALDAALQATEADPAKWDRFAANVLGDRDTPANRALLQEAFAQLVDWQAKAEAMNETPMRSGYGRLDAVGHILNKVLMFAGAPARDGNPANAPVSYPFLWGIAEQERVQWNGIAVNSRFQLPGDPFEYGALGRNTGEVMGVFGEVLLTPATGPASALKGYKSSVDTQNLVRMEQLVALLDPPDWPSHFPAIDPALAAKGRTLFARDCAGCHLTPDLQKEGEPTERMVTFRNTPEKELTDIWMACNAFVYSGPTGPLEGTKDNSGTVFADRAPVANMLATTVKGALIGNKEGLIRAGFDNFFGIRRLPRVEEAFDPDDPRASDRATCLETEDVIVLGYKARPLDGIWATAPYLHNGSVASLAEILLPAAERMPAFWVGNRSYDPVAVGYLTEKPANGRGFLLETVDANGRVIEGNSNRGHEYGVGGLNADDRRALLEYMKTL